MAQKVSVDEVVIDGKMYVQKASQPPPTLDNYHIVRTYSAGVFAGEIVSRNGKEVVMKNARRLWYWDGASSLSQLAMEGTTRPDKCKFPCEVTKVILTEAVEILPCTQMAMESIRGVAVWKQ